MVELAHVSRQVQRSKKLLDEPRVVSMCSRSFDFVTASLREAVTALRMTVRTKVFYSLPSASIGFRPAALIAGSMPLTIPTKPRITVDQIRVAESM